jgi:hypothetical protein
MCSESDDDEAADGNEDSWNLTGGYFCSTIAMNLNTICPSINTLWKAKLKGNGLLCLGEEI